MTSSKITPDQRAALLSAYVEGVFPMADGAGGIGWYEPARRGVIGLHAGGLRVTRSLRQRVRNAGFVITTNRAFGEVIRACAKRRPGQGAEESWIDGRITRWYEGLHALGDAHSVEAWRADGTGAHHVVGGLYGVSLRGLFAGESMFSRPDHGGRDASKVCLYHLWHHLRARGYAVLDCQFWTPHLGSLGAVEISRADYRRLLWAALSRDVPWAPFEPLA